MAGILPMSSIEIKHEPIDSEPEATGSVYYDAKTGEMVHVLFPKVNLCNQTEVQDSKDESIVSNDDMTREENISNLENLTGTPGVYSEDVEINGKDFGCDFDMEECVEGSNMKIKLKIKTKVSNTSHLAGKSDGVDTSETEDISEYGLLDYSNDVRDLDESHTNNEGDAADDDINDKCVGCDIDSGDNDENNEKVKLKPRFKNKQDSKTTPKLKEKKLLYKCGVCDIHFATLVALNYHMVIHTGQKPYKCEICGKSFIQSGHFKSHMLIHSESKPYSCELCNKEFRHTSSLNRHMLIHTGDKPHKCRICGKRFSQSGHLDSHILTHTNEKPHECEICGRKFATSSQVKRHTVIHTGVKGYTCDICGKQFTQSNSLKHHLMAHSKIKPHKCSYCGKGFTAVGQLKIHLRTHTGVKPFKCNECGRTFTQLSNLNTHKLVHSGEKPLKCDICDKKFNQPHHLKDHKAVHHKTGKKQKRKQK